MRTYSHLAPDLIEVAERVTAGMSAAFEEKSVTLALEIDAGAGEVDWRVAAEEEQRRWRAEEEASGVPAHGAKVASRALGCDAPAASPEVDQGALGCADRIARAPPVC